MDGAEPLAVEARDLKVLRGFHRGGARRIVEDRQFAEKLPRQQLRERHRSALEPPLKRLSLDVFDDEEVTAILAADVVDRADVRVIERGDRARFALEPKAVLWIAAV